MQRPTLIARPQRIFQSARQLPIATSAPRTIQRQPIAVPARRPLIDIDFSEPSFDFQVDPYLDYGKCLTDEGGILIVYKDIDDRFRHILWRVFSWTLFTGLAAIYFAPYAPVPDHWIEIAALLAVAIINFLIVRKPVEVYRRVEIRPDCMIIEGRDVFWKRHMEGGFPSFRPGKGGRQCLCGIYGTRFVEYLVVHRFDENDRMFEVISAHLQDAMQQQWSRPH